MLVTGGVYLARVLTDPLAPPLFGASQISCNITTNEMTNVMRYGDLRGPGGKFINPYDHGIKKNCSDFLINGYNEDVECDKESSHRYPRFSPS
ncbi:hypothetical protein RJT34_08434 [Clitoria ternatea]|uniref:Uncharacterized protein n=1 Tax=Clitoria ternatea TaxID=43366 RepID=A0AAN9K6J4_CLITE